MKVRLVSLTEPNDEYGTPEGLIVYCARVSSPNQTTENGAKLISYLIEHKHWSPFEMASMCVEIETSRAIAAQILRHRSFSFQEFSQRYSTATKFETYAARAQDLKNRQNSLDNLPEEAKQWFHGVLQAVQIDSFHYYEEALEKGIAKECARFLLPMSTTTKLYMNGTVRSWIHYLETRTDKSTQKEHRDIALEIKKIFMESFPQTSQALMWERNEYPEFH